MAEPQRDLSNIMSRQQRVHGAGVPQHVRTHVFSDPRAVGHRFDDVLGSPRLDRERLLQREMVSRSTRTRFDIGTTRTLLSLP